MTLTFNARRAMVMIHTQAKIKVKGQFIQKIEWKQTDEQMDRQIPDPIAIDI